MQGIKPTSLFKANVYGATADYLINYDSIKWMQIVQGENLFRVTHLTETNYLKACCSEDSYYECLEKDLANKTECGGLCEVVSMPNDLLPLCSSVRQYECSKSVFNQRIKDENHPCRKEKSCSDLTYDLQELHFEWNWTHTQNVVSFEYTLETPMSSHGFRYHSPYKMVHTEYLLWTEICLIANVGGTLGLTIGSQHLFFSFYQQIYCT